MYTHTQNIAYAKAQKKHKEILFTLTMLHLQREINWSSTILRVLLSLIFICSIFYLNRVA